MSGYAFCSSSTALTLGLSRRVDSAAAFCLQTRFFCRMDAVSIYFKDASYSEAEAIAVSHGILGRQSVFLRNYSEWKEEITEDEALLIRQRLGAEPNCVVLVEAREGVAARVALELAAELMKSLGPAVLDDDFNGLWSLEQIHQKLLSSEDNTIFSIRASLG